MAILPLRVVILGTIFARLPATCGEDSMRAYQISESPSASGATNIVPALIWRFLQPLMAAMSDPGQGTAGHHHVVATYPGDGHFLASPLQPMTVEPANVGPRQGAIVTARAACWRIIAKSAKSLFIGHTNLIASQPHASAADRPEMGDGKRAMAGHSRGLKLLARTVCALLMLTVSLSMAHAASPEKSQPGAVAGPAEAIKGGTLVPEREATGVVALVQRNGGYCGGAVVWQDWDQKKQAGKAYILTAYHCVNEKIPLTANQCAGKNNPYVSEFEVEYRHAGGETVAVSNMCRQPDDDGYGSDVLLVTTEETPHRTKPSDIYQLAHHFDLKPSDYQKTSGTVYGYSTLQPSRNGGPPGLALGPLQAATFTINAMGYALDEFGGTAVSVKSANPAVTTLKGDSGGPWIVGAELVGDKLTGGELVGVLSTGADDTSRYSRVNPEWVQEVAGTVLITKPKPLDYLKEDQATVLTVEGKGPPEKNLQVTLRAGAVGTPPYRCTKDGNSTITIDLSGDWSCTLDLSELPERAAGQQTPRLWAVLDSRDSDEADQPYDRISLNSPAIGRIRLTRPSKSSGNHGKEDKNFTVPGYQMAGNGMRGGHPVHVLQTDAAKVSTVVCTVANVTSDHTWTCPSWLTVPKDGKQYKLNAQQKGPPGGPETVQQSQTYTYQASSTPEKHVQIIAPDKKKPVYTWSQFTVDGKNIIDDNEDGDRNVVELNSPLANHYPNRFEAVRWLKFNKDSGRVHAEQFENGQSTGPVSGDYTVKETKLEIDQPRESGQGGYTAIEDPIPVSGRGTPETRVRVEQVDGSGKPVPNGYTCPSTGNGNSVPVTEQETWTCPDFPNQRAGTYTLKAMVFLPGDGPEKPTDETATRTFTIEIETKDICKDPKGNQPQGVTLGAGEGPNGGYVIPTLSSSSSDRIFTGASQNLGLCTAGKVEVGPDGTWNCTLQVLETGEHTLTVKAYDADDKYINQSQCKFNVEENKDNKPPKNPNTQIPPSNSSLPPPPFPPGPFFWGFVPPPFSPELTVTIDVFEWVTDVWNPFKDKPKIPNIRIDKDTGLWYTGRVDLPKGRKFKIQTYLCKSGDACDATNHYGDQAPDEVQFYTAVSVGDNDAQNVSLGGDVVINGDGQPGATVTVTRDDTDKQICQTKVKVDGKWSCDANHLSGTLGTFTVTVKQTYPTFPDSFSSITLNINTPDVVITGPQNPVTTPTYVLSGTGKPGAFISFANTDQQEGTDQLNGTGTIVGKGSAPIADKNGKWRSPTYVTVRGGPYTVTATQSIDGLAQSKPTSWTYSVVVQDPSIINPTSNQQLPAGQLTVTGKAQPRAMLKLTDGSVQRSVQVDENGDWSSDSYIVAPGQHTLSVQQYIMGKADGSPVAVTYWVTGSIASVVITTPTRGQTIGTPVYTIGGTGQPGGAITVSGAGLDTHRDIPVGSDGKWSTQYVARAGNYTATAVQIINGDENNPLNSSTTVSYSVAGTAAPAPVSITTPAEDAGVDETHSIEGRGQVGAVVSLEGPGDQPCSVEVASSGTWSCGPYTLKPGPYTVVATQLIQTANGLQQSGEPLTRDYTVRKPLTPVTITRPTEGQVITDLVYTVSGTGAAGASVTVKGLGLPDREDIPVKDGSWSTTYFAKSGAYTILATQYIDGKQVGDGVRRSYTVQANATPLTISSPEENQIVDVSPYYIKGSGQPDADVTVSNPSHGPQDAPCQTKVSGDGKWSCGPYDSAPDHYWVQARQTMVVDGKTVALGDPVTRHYSVIKSPPTVTYEIASLTSLTPNGVTAGSYNEGEAVVTKNGGKPLDENETVVVTFTLSSSTASFDTSPSSSPQTLYVNTYKNGKGQDIADADFTDTVPEPVVTLTAKLRDFQDVPSKTQNFKFTPPYSAARIVTGASAAGGPVIVFPANSGFPKTGFSKATFQVQPTGKADDNDQFDWQSSSPYATVGNDGTVVLTTKPDGPYTITANPKDGGLPFVYTVDIAHWFVGGQYYITSRQFTPPADDDYLAAIKSFAESIGAHVPDVKILVGLTDNDIQRIVYDATPRHDNSGSFAIQLGKTGSLYGEWGAPYLYDRENWKVGMYSDFESSFYYYNTSTVFNNVMWNGTGYDWQIVTDIGGQQGQQTQGRGRVSDDDAIGWVWVDAVNLQNSVVTGFCLMFDIKR